MIRPVMTRQSKTIHQESQLSFETSNRTPPHMCHMWTHVDLLNCTVFVKCKTFNTFNSNPLAAWRLVSCQVQLARQVNVPYGHMAWRQCKNKRYKHSPQFHNPHQVYIHSGIDIMNPHHITSATHQRHFKPATTTTKTKISRSEMRFLIFPLNDPHSSTCIFYNTFFLN